MSMLWRSLLFKQAERGGSPSSDQQAFHPVDLSATAGPLGVMMQCAVIGISAGKPLPARDEAHAELETDMRAAETEPSP